MNLAVPQPKLPRWILPKSEDFGGGKPIDPRVIPHLEEHLLAPALDMMTRPGKSFRSRLVQAGHDVAAVASRLPRRPSADTARDLAICAQAIEMLHAGSLIVDDIQDGSPMRRGRAAVHEIYGMAPALTAGNWLYFWPLCLLRELRLAADHKIRLYGYYHEALHLAHAGQSMDVSVRADALPQEEVADVSEFVIRHKTGTVTALALLMGAVVAGAEPSLLDRLRVFGMDFGASLQRFDDLGNVKGKVDPEKRFADLAQRRPSWVWAHAAKTSSAKAYEDFLAAVAALPRADAVEAWMSQQDFVARAERAASEELERAHAELARHMALHDWREAERDLRQLGMQVKNGYG